MDRLLMPEIYISFPTEEDRVRGFYELATRARITSFPAQLYRVPLESLKLLDDQEIRYCTLSLPGCADAPSQNGIRRLIPIVVLFLCGISGSVACPLLGILFFPGDKAALFGWALAAPCVGIWLGLILGWFILRAV